MVHRALVLSLAAAAAGAAVGLLACSKASTSDTAGAMATASAPSAPPAPITQTVTCGGNQTRDYTNQEFQVASGPAILAGGHCKVTLTGCTVSAPAPGFANGAISAAGAATVSMSNTIVKGAPALYAGGSALVELTSGSLEGPVAIDAAGAAHIKASGVTVKGDIKHGRSAIIEGIAGVTGASAADREARDAAKGGCEGYADCYVKAGFSGSVSSTVVVDIGPDGHATSTSYAAGNAPKAAQACMIALGNTKSVSTGPGKLRCDLSGTVSGGNLEIDSSPSFTKK
jgi:hypothetical protein